MTKSRENIKYNAPFQARETLVRRYRRGVGGWGLLPAVAVLLMATWLFPSAAEGEEKIFLIRGSAVHVLDAETGNPLTAVPLEEKIPARSGTTGSAGQPRRIESTPGGKVIFLWAPGVRSAVTLDFDEPGSVGVVDFDPPDSFRGAGALVFSPMGDRLYVAEENTGAIDIYGHKAGNITFSNRFEEPANNSGGGRISLNRRGTRFYRSGTDGLAYYLASDFSVLDTVEEARGRRDWVTAPGGRYLWGVGPQDIVVVDEPRGAVKTVLGIPGSSSLLFDTDGRTGYLLAEAGRTLVVLDPRRAKETGRVDLPEMVNGLGITIDSGIWAAGEENLYGIFRGDIVHQVPLPGNGMVHDLAVVELKPGRGFACF